MAATRAAKASLNRVPLAATLMVAEKCGIAKPTVALRKTATATSRRRAVMHRPIIRAATGPVVPQARGLRIATTVGAVRAELRSRCNHGRPDGSQAAFLFCWSETIEQNWVGVQCLEPKAAACVRSMSSGIK
jgi:hypothetical protein